MEISEILLWVVAAVMLLYTIPACYFDIKHREMPQGFWNVMVTICAPITVVLYLVGYYPWYLALLSIIFCILYLGMALLGWYEGADLWYLIFISVFFVVNPVTGHILIPISFAIFFLASVVGFAMICQAVPKLKSEQFPMMLPITLALWLTVAIA